MSEHGDERLSPAEERLIRLMALLRAEAEADGPFQRAVASRVRLQFVAQQVARAIATFAGAIADGLGLLFGLGPEREEKQP